MSGTGNNGGVVGELRALYRASLKPQDIFWNLYVARPAAAAALLALRRTPLTPNQISFLGLALFLGAPALMVAWPTAWGFLAAAVVVELSYVLDCADGQLARLKGQTSDVGAYLDFFIDEVKALLLVAGAGVGLWRGHGEVAWLFAALGSVLVVAIATSLTTFVRRPEYAGREVRPGTDVTGPPPPLGLLRRAIWLVVRTMRLVVHYPSWILAPALLGLATTIDGLLVFFVVYSAVLVVYLGRTSLVVTLRLASPRFYASPSPNQAGAPAVSHGDPADDAIAPVTREPRAEQVP